MTDTGPVLLDDDDLAALIRVAMELGARVERARIHTAAGQVPGRVRHLRSIRLDVS